jgi:hypothetical protein
MASRLPKNSHDDETLDALEQALRDVWQVLKGWEDDAELKADLAYRLSGSC